MSLLTREEDKPEGKEVDGTQNPEEDHGTIVLFHLNDGRLDH
jgi:hypothetical protein